MEWNAMIGYPAIGDRIGGYRIDAEIGRGGMGIVYRATQLTLNRPVALKVLDPRLAADQSFVNRFSREASILASLDSPHIVQIFDHGNLEGQLHLAMQYVGGGDLSELIRRDGPLAPHAALLVFCQIVEALGDAHARGIVHRDVKPSNVLLRPGDGEPFAYLCDFGIAQTADGSLTQTGMVAGSWAFMGPERHAGAPATPRSDLYSAACVLWAMLTGRNVYTGTDVQIAMSHMNAPVPQLPGSDPLVVSLNRLLWACLAKNPEERPDSAAETLVLARGPLAIAAGVPPLSVPKPDSGIFRPARSATATADGTRHAPTLAPVPFAVGAQPVQPLATSAPDTPPSGRRWSPLAVVAGVGALALTVALVFTVLTWSGTLGRPVTATTPSVTAPLATPSATPSATPTTYECWDGTVADELAECSFPNGREGLHYVYPALDPASCTFRDYRESTGAYECAVGTRGLIRYRFWRDAAESKQHYAKKYAKDTNSPMLLDGNEVGILYRSDRRVSGIYTMSGLWLDGHLSFSVESSTVADREALLDLVEIRAYDQLNGRPRGSTATLGRLG
jgi:serine/threonine protein kinase